MGDCIQVTIRVLGFRVLEGLGLRVRGSKARGFEFSGCAEQAEIQLFGLGPTLHVEHVSSDKNR